MKSILFCCLSVLSFIACSNQQNESLAWDTLHQALDSLYTHNFNAYIEFVDSSDVDKVGKDCFLASLKQKYLDNESELDSSCFTLENLEVYDNKSIVIYYSIYTDNKKKCYTQKMTNHNGKWKLKFN